MPHLDGPHLAERLREIDPALPIIHLSGSHSGYRRKDMPADVPTFLKPFNLGDLVAEAERLIRVRSPGDA